MDHRERILTAIAHAEPDRVPTALWGSAYGVTDPLYFSLLKALSLGDPVSPFRPRRGHTVNYYDDRVLDALDVDVRHVWLGFDDLGGPVANGADAWGVGWAQAGIYLGPVRYPLEAASIDDLVRYAWPEVEQRVRRDELRERAKHLKEETDYAVIGRAADSYGPLERCCSLRRIDRFMIDLGAHPEFVVKLIDHVTDVLCRLLEIYLDTAGQYLDVIELPGDDYAAANPLISPKMFDRFFAPAYRRIIGLIKDAAPHCKVLFHSDGRMEPLLGRLIDLGVDVFHCLEPMPNVDLASIKAKYGDRLCFWGAIDIKAAMPGSIDRIEAEVQERTRVLAPGGGYVLAPANHLQPDVPAKNVIALFEAARKYGMYPLSL
jgi:uroporphyrinogen decarboxylase